MADQYPSRKPITRALSSLPENFQPAGAIDLSKNRAVAVALNVIGLVLLAVFGWIFMRLAVTLRPDILIGGELPFSINSIPAVLWGIGAVLAISALVAVFHEAVHGLFFWIFTRSRPVFGLRSAYAYAAAPGWFIPRDQYIWVGLSPLIVLTLLGSLGLTFVPDPALLPLVMFMTFNATGAVGDMWVVVWLLTRPRDVLVQDYGDRIVLYSPRRA